MSRLSMEIPHTLGREEATRRIKEELPKAREKVTELDEKWEDHTLIFHFQVMGFKIGGTLAVADTSAKLEVDLPLAAMMVKSMIEQRIRQEFATILA